MSKASGEIKAEPDLTPLLDIVFQLITFFMLVINFGNDNYDQRVRLPVAASAAAVEPGPVEEDRLVLNIDKEGRLLINGAELTMDDAMKEIRNQADIKRRDAERYAEKKKLPKPDPNNLSTNVIIRCDRVTPYSDLYRLITACQERGFRKFSLKAMNAEG